MALKPCCESFRGWIVVDCRARLSPLKWSEIETVAGNDCPQDYAHRSKCRLYRLGASQEAEARVLELSGPQIRDLRLSGVDISAEVRVSCF